MDLRESDEKGACRRNKHLEDLYPKPPSTHSPPAADTSLLGQDAALEALSEIYHLGKLLPQPASDAPTLPASCPSVAE